MFRDRGDAGRQLAELVDDLRDVHPVVLGLPRGGVVVAAAVAAALDADLDVIVVRKIGMPGQAEYAVGALGEGGVRVLDQHLMAQLGVEQRAIDRVERDEQEALDRRVTVLRERRPIIDLTGRTAIIVDDGLATGATARAACLVARARGAARIVLAVPCAPRDAVEKVREADELRAVILSDSFRAVGQFYRVFEQTSDAEVLALLAELGAR
jgi:putative phosphoribosyl transferase